MELKDVILSTLAEMEDDTPVDIQNDIEEFEPKESKYYSKEELAVEQEEQSSSLGSELIYLNSIRERLLVLFEGFQAPNNSNIEAKVDMTLNFLEYTLATIDARVQILEKGAQK
jgi:formate-dependent nitrite reductase cytochrome c552 subunit